MYALKADFGYALGTLLYWRPVYQNYNALTGVTDWVWGPYTAHRAGYDTTQYTAPIVRRPYYVQPWVHIYGESSVTRRVGIYGASATTFNREWCYFR